LSARDLPTNTARNYHGIFNLTIEEDFASVVSAPPSYACAVPTLQAFCWANN
jgi:hypothetical protein